MLFYLNKHWCTENENDKKKDESENLFNLQKRVAVPKAASSRMTLVTNGAKESALVQGCIWTLFAPPGIDFIMFIFDQINNLKLKLVLSSSSVR